MAIIKTVLREKVLSQRSKRSQRAGEVTEGVRGGHRGHRGRQGGSGGSGRFDFKKFEDKSVTLHLRLHLRLLADALIQCDLQ